MSSERRIRASRANGAKSKGPVTPDGKARSSRNATRHGLLSDLVVLETESVTGFETLFDIYLQRFQPADDVEDSLVEELASATWRIRRSWAVETRALEQRIHDTGGDAIDAMTACFTDPQFALSLELVNRYETRLHRMYQRALRDLMLLRRDRKEASDQKPAAPTEPEIPARPAPTPPSSGPQTEIAASAPSAAPAASAPLESDAAPNLPQPPPAPQPHPSAAPLVVPVFPSFRTSPAIQKQLLSEISKRT